MDEWLWCTDAIRSQCIQLWQDDFHKGMTQKRFLAHDEWRAQFIVHVNQRCWTPLKSFTVVFHFLVLNMMVLIVFYGQMGNAECFAYVAGMTKNRDSKSFWKRKTSKWSWLIRSTGGTTIFLVQKKAAWKFHRLELQNKIYLWTTFGLSRLRFSSWIFAYYQDLKDYARQAGEVTYGDAHKQRQGEG